MSDGRKAPVSNPRIGHKPAPPPAPPSGRSPAPLRNHEHDEDAEAVAMRIVALLNKVELSVGQANRIAMIVAARAMQPEVSIAKAEHVLALIDTATIDRDEAKLIGLRAIRRARHVEEAKRIPPGRSR